MDALRDGVLHQHSSLWFVLRFDQGKVLPKAIVYIVYIFSICVKSPSGGYHFPLPSSNPRWVALCLGGRRPPRLFAGIRSNLSEGRLLRLKRCATDGWSEGSTHKGFSGGTQDDHRVSGGPE